MDLLFCESNPIPIKAALALRGAMLDGVRLPLLPLTAPNRERLKVALKEFGLL
jgi:4-hydroxy-tetrahydrodipicolinate synthase